jgi:hypothetical protein
MQLSIGGPSNSSVEQLTSAQCTLDSGHTIQIDHANGATLLVYAADGKLVLKHIVQGAQEKIEFNPKNTGVYVYQLMQKKKLLSTGKWLINY